MMKVITLLGLIVILTTSTLEAAPLKNLSEKLTSSGGDKTKERIPFTETHDTEVNNASNNEGDDDVEELDKLKSQKDINREVVNLTEKLENSLKKLHDTNPHHHQNVHVEKPSKSFKASKMAFESGPNDITESTTVKQHEILENLPLPDASEITTSPKMGHRRSLQNDLTLNPGNMLRQLNGKYSAYDMAQYIFWTGDEDGVAKAVEELIEEGLMSRENAITFLSDIRLGIDYLENTYSLKSGEHRNTIPFARMTSTTSTTEQPIDDMSYSYNYQKFHSLFKPSFKTKLNYGDDETPTLSPVAFKALEKIPSLMKLAEINNMDNRKEPMPVTYDDESGRVRLADFLYGEYSLEEVIYQLAKTMFTQSLTHGSEESQTALQKLTQFLESEGKHGRISQALQKKVLDVLLAALSDTLTENPDVLEKARHALTTK